MRRSRRVSKPSMEVSYSFSYSGVQMTSGPTDYWRSSAMMGGRAILSGMAKKKESEFDKLGRLIKEEGEDIRNEMRKR
jgi:hypothetical protein